MSDEKTSGVIEPGAKEPQAPSTCPEAQQPGAPQADTATETAESAIHAALAPIRSLVWGFEQLEEFLANHVGAKLKNTPAEQIVTPKANIVAPALEAVRFALSEPHLQEAYANLIATAMTDRMRDRVFPSFVEILKQLTPDEARILRRLATRAPVPIVHIRRENEKRQGTIIARNLSLVALEAGCHFPNNVQSYLDNLDRLGVVRMFSRGSFYTDDGLYSALETNSAVLALKASIALAPGLTARFERSGLELTALGVSLIEACIMPYDDRRVAVARLDERDRRT